MLNELVGNYLVLMIFISSTQVLWIWYDIYLEKETYSLTTYELGMSVVYTSILMVSLLFFYLFIANSNTADKSPLSIYFHFCILC